IYGMYGSDGIRTRLHETLVNLNDTVPNTRIYYSKVPVHSKCYVWKHNNEIVHALVGSANFSTNGLSVPFKEVLAETTYDTFAPLNTYISKILENSIECSEGIVRSSSRAQTTGGTDENICRMILFDPKTNEVQNANGLNWGQSAVAHTNPNDANIPIRADYIRNYPQLFPPKQEFPLISTGGRSHRHNDSIEIIWDDGTTMEGLLEGNYPIKGINYPKQISSFPEKRILGEYIRRRIGVPLGHRVTKRDLDRYGRSDIEVSLLAEGIYYFDFSVNR
ncbi:MAG: NgoFVII family restriction endonuclease, partial [bacterium]|nr:NgoFVII family restriction endonuclease [bacterium]